MSGSAREKQVRRHFCVAAAAAVSLAGCTSIGPRSVAVDRFDYSTAIADSWKEQTLLNVVKLRYVDLPVFVDVASIVAGYSLQTGVSVNGVVSSSGAVQGNYGSLGGQAVYTDRPTITYVPMTGEKFLRGLLTPIDPKNIFFMLQSGYAADFVLGLTVESLNGVRNSSTARGIIREADPEFLRVLELLRDVQSDGAFGMRVEEDKTKGPTAVVFFRRDDVAPELAAKADEIRRLLRLSPDAQKFSLTYSPMRGGENELTVNSRSMLQIMGALASYVEIPDAHLQDRSATPAFVDVTGQSQVRRARIRSGKERPEQAYATVRYRDHWYWVDESDAMTKRAFTAVMFFFTLADTGTSERLPLITIPAQ
jgi:3'-phosphoadenosine 5'-phosphosulfate sulfotransferase